MNRPWMELQELITGSNCIYTSIMVSPKYGVFNVINNWDIKNGVSVFM